MACKTSYELHHNFPKIADEAGFTFNTHRPRIHIDWSKIRLIDIENLIRERRFVLIEQHVNDILDCVLESEFDVRILDEGVMKLFRLAQLAVEYQQFCRHYLDRSVHVLREEITSLAQELDVTKKELREREEEIRKLKRKSKQTYRHTPIPYGNENIASMILKTLSHKNEIFSCSTGDALQYNKCSYCDKVFLNQLYLKSHISRRHPNVLEIPQRDSEESTQQKPSNTENMKLSDEILDLKLKLKELENVIINANQQVNSKCIQVNNNRDETNKVNLETADKTTKQTKDVEVATNNEDYLLDRIEEWKKEEQEKYHKEINLLRTQIMESIQSFKESPTAIANSDIKIIDQLNKTISKQGAEILALKQELTDSRLKIEKEEAERRQESDTQMKDWANRAETHAKQYELLLLKLNEVAREAQDSRVQAEAERSRVAQLEDALQQNLKHKATSEKENNNLISTKIQPETPHKETDKVQQNPAKKKALTRRAPEADRQTLEKLHQKAQALLNMRSSSSFSDTSTEENIPKSKLLLRDTKNTKLHNHKNGDINKVKQKKAINHVELAHKKKKQKTQLNIESEKEDKEIKTKSHSVSNIVQREKNGPVFSPGSPMKILRAKLTEEVNNRLISTGVDPLKSGLPKTEFQKRKMLLQEQLEIKAKKNASHEKVRHSILAHLDSTVPKKVSTPTQEYVSPNKVFKAFSLTSVISNVKSKALSLVKSSDTSNKDKRMSLNAEVAKRAMSILNTPPDSVPSSPANKYNKITTEAQFVSNTEPRHKRLSLKKNRDLTPEKRDKLTTPSQNTSVTNTDSENDSVSNTDSENDSNESDHKYYNTVVQESSKSIESLIKSPARRPLSAIADYNNDVKKYTIFDNHLHRSQSATNIANQNEDIKKNHASQETKQNDVSDSESSAHIPAEELVAKNYTLSNPKQTKGVLKNASSTSSLNKKKVLFDMDAIQMKSLSASPSQSLTEKSDGNEKYELGLINLDGEEWDISSIENEPLKNDTKLQIGNRTSPKITELKQTIESQLARRTVTPSTAIVGSVDVLAPVPTPLRRASSIGGSNTSLGSSILDESESLPPVVNHKAFVKPKTITSHKDDSELDLSEFSTDGLISNKNERDAF